MKKIFSICLKEFEGISCMDDFYKGVPGLLEFMDDFNVPKHRVFMERKSCERLFDYMLQRVPHNHSGKARWDRICAGDWPANAPSIALEDVPPNEVWVFTPGTEVPA